MQHRRIPQIWLDALLSKPEQRIAASAGVDMLQSRFAAKSRKMFILRAVVEVAKAPPLVVTVYRTTKIAKYWRP